MSLFSRDRLEIFPLARRVNTLDIRRDAIDPATYPVELTDEAFRDVEATAAELRRAKKLGASRVLTYGAHSIKNGLGPVLSRLAEGGWLTHLTTNGAGVIHDWEFAFQGESGEDVRRYATEGQFGIWEETGRFINLAIIVGAYRGLGYGASVGQTILDEGFEIPTDAELRDALDAGAKIADEAVPPFPSAASQSAELAQLAETLDRAAAAADLLRAKRRFALPDGKLEIAHPFREYSTAFRTRRADVRFTCGPMIGCDIIYTHPANDCAAIGRAAQRDFLLYADSVSRLEGGVYLSVGSAVLSPMIFEKSLAMSRNVARQEGRSITDFSIHVVDLAESTWDWTRDGEPPQTDPAYYHRYCKTFSRMGGRMTYCGADNRSWFVALLNELEKTPE
ncbi:MAG: hypothetical protein IJ387_01290 [Thermoguttaceae bacterium]|nr:hypothetical protein [Thermoguttaceae bacterium]